MMAMTFDPMLIVAFLGGSLGLVAVYVLVSDLFLDERRRVAKRVLDATSGLSSTATRKLFKNLDRVRAESVASTVDLKARLRSTLEQAGIDWEPKFLLAASAGGTTAGFCVCVLWASWPMILGVTLLSGVAPFAYVLFHRRRRMITLRRQLPDAFDLMSRAARSGLSMSAAFQQVASDCSPPLGEEFAYCCEQQRLGLDAETSLRELSRRTGVVELQMFSVAMLVQRQSGGNPTEILGNLSEVVRKRLKLERRIRGLTSEGRMQAWVLALLPVCAFIAELIIDPEYAQVLIQRPSLLGATGVSMLFGMAWIRQIIQVDY